MKPYKAIFLALLYLCLFSCADDPSQNESSKSEKQASPSLSLTDTTENKVSEPELDAKSVTEQDRPIKKEPSPPLSPAELKEADRIIAFSNQSRDIFQKGLYGAAAYLKHSVDNYRENWHLAQRPKLPETHKPNPNLQIPAGIFDKAEEEQLSQALNDMDKALNDLLNNYRQLEKYIADPSIRDDGKQGLKLSSKASDNYLQYMKARHTWMEIVEAKAEEAEAKLLREHPLQRQILAAKNIFAQMRELGELLSANSDRQTLTSLRQNLNAIIAEAGKPPFQAAPSLERLYKNFLKEAEKYSSILDRGILEGFHNIQRRELNASAAKCREAYNEFVRAANNLTDRKS